MYLPSIQSRCKFIQTTTDRRTEDIAVSDTFDELQRSLVEKEILHPSEECHRQKWFGCKWRVFDVINFYHVFCRFCKKHLYSRSVPTDINSFFQTHINTDYHREFRDMQFPHCKEIISWEEKWKIGRCNVCQMSGLAASVRDMDCTPNELFNEHYCVGMRVAQHTNEQFLRKLSLLKNYCQLSVFREKFIKPLEKGSVCLLCWLKIPWSGEDVKIHLGSQLHMNQFFKSIEDWHNLSPNDLLNGFNLENITRWIYRCIFVPSEVLQLDYERYKLECLLTSFHILTAETALSSSHYCPVVIEKLLANQQNSIDQCTIDNFDLMPKCQRDLNSLAASVPNKASREDPLQAYAGTIEKYKQLKEGTNLLRLKVKLKNDNQTYFRNLFSKKLTLIQKPQSESYQNCICQVCDVKVPCGFAAKHATDFGHLYHYKKWQELKRSAADKRFFELFQKVSNNVFCLLCGVSAKLSHFFFHLKSSLHTKRFKWYCTLKNEVPISSAIEVTPNLSVVCYLCDSFLLKETHKEEIKIALGTIREHWPCPVVTKEGKETVESFDVRKDEERASPICAGIQGTRENDGPTNTLNLRSIENAMRGIVEAYEDAIFERVLDKTKSTLRDIKAGLMIDEKQRHEAACECGKPRSQCNCGKPNFDSSKLEANERIWKEVETIHLNHSKNEKSDYKKTEFNEAEEDKGQEILVISGLPRCEKELIATVWKLGGFGEIQAVYHEGSSVKVVFVERGVAGKVAGMKLFRKNRPPVTMKVDEVKKTSVVGSQIGDFFAVRKSKFPPLPSYLLELLQQPSKLSKFVANLTATAVASWESVEELEREKSVCATINSAVRQLFPQCRCYPFGSRLSGLMLRNSDLDVFLDRGGVYKGTQDMSQIEERRLIHKVADALRQRSEVKRLTVIDRARVPILSFLHSPTNIHCDLSFKNALSVHNTLLIKFFVSLDHRVKFVIVFLKYWIRQNGIHGPPYFSSYAITMMAIFYLQQLNPPLLPTVEELQNAFVGQRLTIGGWDCNFNENVRDFVRKGSDYPLHVILEGFFSYYANFDYAKYVISPLDGKLLLREAFSSDSQVKLPMCYKRHILNFPLPMEKLVCQTMPLCVIDPFDLSHVLTKSFTPTGLHTFKHFCQLSTNALQNGGYK